jgi:hypothetical protein
VVKLLMPLPSPEKPPFTVSATPEHHRAAMDIAMLVAVISSFNQLC